MTWPPRWDGPQWKQGRTATKKAKQKIRRKLGREEKDNKVESKRRDGHRCRFPRCECRKIGLRLESSHRDHKGMGGNPTGERNATENLMTLCFHRHKDAPRFSIDKGGITWEPLTAAGANGPVRWLIDLASFPGWPEGSYPRGVGMGGPVVDSKGRVYRELAREKAVQQLEDLTDWQLEVLDEFADMEL